MDFWSLAEKAEVMGKGIGNFAGDAASHLLDDLNNAIPTIHALGLDVKDLHMELGLPPEISLKLIGQVESINVVKLKDLAAKNRDKKVLVTMLKALETAYNFKQQLKDLKLEGIEIDLKLGLLPKVHVGFVN